MAGATPNGNEFLGLRTNQVAFSRKVNSTMRAVRGFGEEVRRANQQSVRWLADRAASNLYHSVAENRYRDRRRTGQLEEAILSDSSHAWSQNGFRFMIEDAMYRQARYYRVIEEGSHQFVGKRIFLIFEGGQMARAPFVEHGRRIAGAKDGRGRNLSDRVRTIHNPIPDYRYAERAVAAFEGNDVYRDFIRAAKVRFEDATGVAVRL